MSCCTSHAARSLAAAQTSERVAELARGLAYWAATYFEVPGPASTAGQKPPSTVTATTTTR